MVAIRTPFRSCKQGPCGHEAELEKIEKDGHKALYYSIAQTGRARSRSCSIAPCGRPLRGKQNMPWDKPYNPLANQRLRPELYGQINRVYFMTIRAYNDLSPFTVDDLNKLMLDVLREEQERQSCTVFTYCLMPDHLHFLVSPRIEGISVLKFTDRFKGKATNRSWATGWRGKLWQPRYYDHIVRLEEDLYRIATYILNNPVRKKMVESPEDWPWSGNFNQLP